MCAFKKKLEQYETESTREGDCLVHKTRGVARKVYKLRHGDIPSNVLVCHVCDNPLCIEDAHHFPGSHKDNTQDAVRKGRHSGFRKGGVKFSGHHTDEAKQKISAASVAMWKDQTIRAEISKRLSIAMSKFTADQWAERGKKIWEKRRANK